MVRRFWFAAVLATLSWAAPIAGSFIGYSVPISSGVFGLGDSLGAAAAESDPAGIRAALQPLVDKHHLAGAVTLVANREKVLDVQTVGFADVGAKEPLRADALFWIASMSKPITGTALMLLVDEGKIQIDDPVEKYLPEFKNMWVAVEQTPEQMVLRRPTHPLTIREALSHTSGLAFKSAMEEPTLDGLPLRDAVRSYTQMPLTSQPGTKYLYSNAGINTGGRIIEVVSGMKYEEFLEKRLFAPLGMKDTTFYPSEAQVRRLAKVYRPNAAKDDLEETRIGQLTYPLSGQPRYPMPGGGLFSTATDLAAFCQMILNEGQWNGTRFMSPESVKRMVSKQTPEAVKDGYGVGWSTSGESFGHGGALSTNMTIEPRRNLITIYLVQHAGFPGEGGRGHGLFKQSAEKKFGSSN
ncbi:MAG: serine hydrolase domain-containing protein [Planctomycetota bacterium]